MRAPATACGRRFSPALQPLTLAVNHSGPQGRWWWPGTRQIDPVPVLGPLPDGTSSLDKPPAVADSLKGLASLHPYHVWQSATLPAGANRNHPSIASPT